MPQMAPLNWTLLYFMFSFIYLIMIIMNYYNFLYSPSFKTKKINIKMINWKW